MRLHRLILAGLLFVTGLAHADWAADRAGSTGYVTVTTLASVIDEAVPFCVVYLSDLPAGFHTAMSTASDTDGKTIRVSTSDGSTQLACVPLGVNTGTDTGCLIFLGTGMSASVDVSYRIYVGNAALTMPSASGGMGEQAVFAAYAAMYFPGMSTRDFTSGGRTLTAVGTPTTATSPYEGITAAEFNGTSQYYMYSGTPVTQSVPIHLSASFYSDVTNLNSFLVGITRSSASSNDQSILAADGNFSADKVAFTTRGNGGGNPKVLTSTAFSASTWYIADGTRDALVGTSKAYINGGSVGTDTTTLSSYGSQDRTGIGAVDAGGIGGYLDGRIAWIGLHLTANSANFIATQKQNWDGNLYSVGSWTPLSVSPGTTGWVLFQTVGQSSTAAVDWLTTSNVLVDDATYAYCTVDDSYTTTEYLNLTNPAYGTTIPVGAPSYTVEYRIKRYRGNTSGGDRVYDVTVQMIDETGTRVGDNLALTGTDWTTSATTQDYVVTGKTIDGGDFDADTGLAIRTDGAGAVGTVDPRVVTVWMKVSWTGTDQTAKARGFFALTE